MRLLEPQTLDERASDMKGAAQKLRGLLAEHSRKSSQVASSLLGPIDGLN